MSTIPKDLGAGGRYLAPKGAAGKPSLKQILDGIADDLAANMTVPAWSASQSVVSNAKTLTGAGWVFTVHATAGDAAGPKAIISTGAPAAGQVRVTYASGVATLTFNATDNISACVVQKLPYVAPTTTKES